MNKKYFLPKHLRGKPLSKSEYVHTTPRTWSKGEIKWLLKLKANNISNKDVAVYMDRTETSIHLKYKRLQKSDGKTYNHKHRDDKYKTNDEFLELIKPKSVLDLYAGDVSFYQDKVKNIVSNDTNPEFNTTYNERAEVLSAKLCYSGHKFDLVDIDPFGSGFECLNTSIQMAKSGIIVTLGEMGHKRYRRLHFVNTRYNISTMGDFTSENIVKEIIKIGKRYKKQLEPVYIKDWNLISRVYFRIHDYKVLEQWVKI